MQDEELVGDLYQVPDKWWGFEAQGRKNHPGACVGYEPPGYKVILFKGTDPRSEDFRFVQIRVRPDSHNNLLKETSFAVNPRPFSARKIGLLSDELIGVLDGQDLRRMQSELRRQFVDEE